MDVMFICKECGNIYKYDNKGTIGLKCSECNTPMGWEESFPPLTAINFMHSADYLFEQSKKQDKENLENEYNAIGKSIDKTLLDKWNNKYEKWLEKYPDNDDTVWIERDDKFEDIICTEMGTDLGLSIFAAIQVCNRNYFRKPYIIIIASLIEQLFNDFFRTVIERKLPEYGRKIFLERYDTAGIQATINIVESFLDESLAKKMDKYSKGFFDRWTSLRKLRNDIIHSNSTYVSKNKISQINKMIEESLLVFCNLKSEIIKT